MGQPEFDTRLGALATSMVVKLQLLLRRGRTECLDLLELVLLPGLAAMLPWRWCYAVFKRMARWRWLYRESCEMALEQARDRGWAGQDEVHWLWVRKLVTLVDHADHYLGLWRSDAWMTQFLQVQGEWPQSQPLLLITFHWGAGYWGLRHASAHSLQPHALVATLGSQVFVGRTVLSWYANSRNAHVSRTLGAINFDASKDLKQVVRALREGHSLLGVVDVPADDGRQDMPIQLLGMQARVPRGLLRLAVDQRVKVVVYVTGLNVNTGQRFLRIESLQPADSIESLAASVFGRLEGTIAENAPAWHFWGVADRFFR